MREARAAIGRRYDEAFAALPLQLPAHPTTPGEHAWHLYVVRLRDDAPIGRDAFIQRMAAEHQVSTSVPFIPLHRHPYWQEVCAATAADLPHAEDAFARTVSLPIFSAMTDAQVDQVIDAVRALVGP